MKEEKTCETSRDENKSQALDNKSLIYDRNY